MKKHLQIADRKKAKLSPGKGRSPFALYLKTLVRNKEELIARFQLIVQKHIVPAWLSSSSGNGVHRAKIRLAEERVLNTKRQGTTPLNKNYGGYESRQVARRTYNCQHKLFQGSTVETANLAKYQHDR